MTTMAAFREVVPVISARVNGATKDYTFYIKPLVPISAGSAITIQILDNTNGTNEISLPSTLSCPIYYNNNTIATTCTVSGSTATIVPSLPLSDASGTIQYILVVSSMILARTPRSSSNFRITSLTGSGFGVQTTMISSIPNNEPNNIQLVGLTIVTQPSRLNEK